MRDDRIQYFAENMDRLSRRDRIFLNNPVIMQGLGLAIIIIPATNLKNALILATAVLLLMTPTRMIATFIGQRTGFKFRAVIYALTAGLVYVAVSYIMEGIFGPDLASVGIYLPLLVMDPIILKRYESPKRERLSTSFKKGIITTIGFCLTLFLVAALRELMAQGTVGGIEVFRVAFFPMAQMPAGGFFILAFVVAAWRGMVNAFKKSIGVGVKKLP